MDQIAAQELGRAHAAGVARAGASKGATSPARATSATAAPTPTPSPGAAPTTPLPMENNPRVAVRAAVRRRRQHRSRRRGSRGSRPTAASSTRSRERSPICSAGSARATAPSCANISTRSATSSGASRRRRSRATGSCRSSSSRRGVPASFEDHAKLMFDLQVLAYQTDLTRVITFMLGRELSGRTFPEIGVAESHHPISHHQNDPASWPTWRRSSVITRRCSRITSKSCRPHAGRRRLAARPHGDRLRRRHGRRNLHAPSNLPVMIAGGASGHIKAGRHVKYKPARRWRTSICGCWTSSACTPALWRGQYWTDRAASRLALT